MNQGGIWSGFSSASRRSASSPHAGSVASVSGRMTQVPIGHF
jgi:hypothetical protein